MLLDIHKQVEACNSCTLSRLMPDGMCVAGVGPENAKIMLIGEALGENEADKRIPFVGRAGQLLNKMLFSVGIKREDCYITNAVKGRPYDRNGKYKKNRPPSALEINACKRHLWTEIQAVKPLVIGALGLIPARLLLDLKKSQTLKSVIGQPCAVEYTEAPIFVMYHPSFIMQYQPGQQFHMEKVLVKMKGIVDESSK